MDVTEKEESRKKTGIYHHVKQEDRVGQTERKSEVQAGYKKGDVSQIQVTEVWSGDEIGNGECLV